MLKTGDKVTRKPITEIVLTKPETISSLTVSEINTGKIQLRCFTIYTLQFTIYNLQFTIYNLQFTIYNIQFTIYNTK